jgi:predicted transposase/invertase (TIGR01784 family)
MKTDSLFYRLFKYAPELVLELADIKYTGRQGYRFCSEEIKQTAFRLDGILTPPQENIDLPVIFVEVQFQPDLNFYSRFFCEIFFYLHQNKPIHPWQAVVIYPTRKVETGGSLHYSTLLESDRIKRIYLEDIKDPPTDRMGLQLIQLIVVEDEKTIITAQNLLKHIRIQADQETVKHWLEWVETILVYKLPRLSREEIQKMLGYNDIELKQTRFYQDVFTEGQQQGLQKGLQKGLHDGEAKILIRHFKRLFNDLPADTISRIQHLNSEQLETLADHLFEIETLSDLDAWLDQI